jgi:hypothetical protein
MAYTNAIFYLDILNGNDAVRTTLPTVVFSNPAGNRVMGTSVGHGLVTGACITVAGTTNWNGVWKITRNDNDTFDLDIASWIAGADNTGTVVPFGGQSWADAWKTFNNGATSVRISSGDIIRIAKSPDTTSVGQNATWTKGSNVVTLTTAVTENISTCDTIWTASANVTSTVNSTINKEGVGCSSNVIATAFTTGLISYYALGSAVDFSGYQQVSFWYRTSVTKADSTFSLRLCSDVAGVTTVNTIMIPNCSTINTWHCATVNTGGALGSSIQSIALYAEVDPGAVTIYLDNIIACKSTASADSISLRSLISKNSLSQGGTEAFYPLKSINGTTLILGGDTTASIVSDHPKYSGTTETVALYKREALDMGDVNVYSTSALSVDDEGTVTDPIQFQAGFNTSTSLQDGETFIDRRNGAIMGWDANGQNYIVFNRMSAVRCLYGIFQSIGGVGFTLQNVQTVAACEYGLNISGANAKLESISNAINCNTRNVYLAGFSIVDSIVNASGMGGGTAGTTSGIHFGAGAGTIVRNAGNIEYCNTGITIGAGNNVIIRNTTINNSIATDISYEDATVDGDCDLYNCSLGSSTKVVLPYTTLYRKLRSTRQDKIDGNHWVYDNNGNINSQTAVRHTASGIAWKMSPNTANKRSNFPLEMSLCKVACASGTAVTVKAFLRRDNIGIEGRIRIKGGTMQGVTSDVSANITVGANTWEELTISFTPTSMEVAEIFVQAYYPDSGTTYTYSIYVDDITVTQI